ncbi:MAG: ATP-binding cassette domain-containing protein [Bacillota bacterium]|nr:ATP-binding cassette domain-containing protein [Bacillota bacterium]
MSIAVEINRTLGDFTLDIRFESEAERIGILGASGCGKSLTLKSIAGIEKPDSGRISLDGKVFFDSAAKINVKPQKRNVGYMFQNYALFPTMTVADNIAAGLHAPGRRTGLRRRSTGTFAGAGEEAEPVKQRVAEMIKRFHLQGLEKHLPEQLSGGQQQRVALARIMACRPDLIMLDEPFSALDQHLKERLQHEMLEMLEDYHGQVIMVSHSRDEIYRFSEELIILDGGKAMATGQTKRLFNDPGNTAVARMTGCKNITPAIRVDAHHLRLPEWGADLRLEREIPEGISAIGYRAHSFEPVWGEKKGNCIPFHIAGADELPFERRYYLIPAGSGNEAERICWFVQDNDRRLMDRRPAPDFLRFREEAIMLLRER